MGTLTNKNTRHKRQRITTKVSSQSPNKTVHAPFKGVLSEQCQLLFSGLLVLFVLESLSAAALAGVYWSTEISRTLLSGWLLAFASGSYATKLPPPVG